MIQDFQNSIFSQFVDINSTSLERIAYNIYNKMKFRGVVPEYVDRDRSENTEILAFSATTQTESDLDFTFGVATEGDLSLVNAENLGKVFNISFEFKPLAASFDIDILGISFSEIEIVYPFAVSVAYNFDVDTIYKARFERNHTTLRVYINNTLVSTQTLSNDNDYSTGTDLVETSTGSALVGNVKIYGNGFIYHWWKLNNYTIDSGNFIYSETGKQSVDFYSVYFSLALFTAVFMQYVEKVLSIKDLVFLQKRFLRSNGINFQQTISDIDLLYLFENWIKEFKNRGTGQIFGTSGQVFGEFLRLIEYQLHNEFISAVVKKGEISWNIGNSSPLSFQALNVSGLNKVNFTDLANVPFVFSVPEDVSIVDNAINVEFTAQNQIFEIGSFTTLSVGDYENDFLLPVANNCDYEFSFSVEFAEDVEISFGVNGFDIIKDLEVLNPANTNPNNLFFESVTSLNVFKGSVLNIRAIAMDVLSNSLASDSTLNLPDSGYLAFTSNVIYVRPYLYVKNTFAGLNSLKISNFRVAPLSLPISNGAISGGNRTVFNFIQNNSNFSETYINQFASKLFNYNQIVKNIYK